MNKAIIILVFCILVISSYTYADAIQDNLISWYSFDTDYSDSSSNSADAISGGTGQVFTGNTCKVSTCLSLLDTDANSYVNLSALVPYLVGNTSGSVVFWMYQNETIAQQCLYSFGEDDANYLNINTRAISLNSLRGYGKDVGGALISDSDTDEMLPIQTWYFVAITHHDNLLQIYVDGDLVENSSNYWADDWTVDTVEFGRYFYSIADPNFLGLIDELEFYDDALHPTNVTYLYNSGNGLSYSDVYGTVTNMSITNTTYNMTSDGGCTAWGTNTSENCNTTDGTPTLTFNTNLVADCSIRASTSDSESFPEYNATIACGTTGGKSHICTVYDADKLDFGQNYLYASCTGNVNSTSSPLYINMTAGGGGGTGLVSCIQTVGLGCGAIITNDCASIIT